MGENEMPQPAAPRPSRAGLKWAAAAVALGVAAAAGAAYLGWAHVGAWVKQQVVATAKQEGILLELNNIEGSLSHIQLRNARASLPGVPGLTATVETIDIGLSRFKPNRIQINGARLQLVGPPLVLMGAIQSWQSKYPATASLSVPPIPEIKNIQITWQEALNSPPFLQLKGVTFATIAQPYGPIGQDFAVTAQNAQVGTFSISPLAAAIHTEAESAEIGLGATKWDGLTVRGGWRKQLNADELHLSFGPVDLGPLLAKTGVSVADKSLAAAALYGGISVLIPNDGRKPYQGIGALAVKGWTPPHPPELQGFPFGKATKLESSFELDRTLTSASFSNTRLTSGEFRLAGHAVAHRSSPTTVRVQAELKGQIPCQALAGAAATSQLGRAYGQWVGEHAGQLVEGNVAVTVQIDADSGSFSQAKVVKQMGVGCGLKPLSVQDLLTLGLPPLPDADLIKHIGKDLPNWGAPVPPMPSMKLPDFNSPEWFKPKGR